MSSSTNSSEAAPSPARPSHWETYLLLARCLRGCVSGESAALPVAVSWEGLIAAAGHHLVTPALAWCLRDDAALPAPVRQYLETVATLNRQRNVLLHEVLLACLRPLNAAGITPVLLKGIASLESRLYPEAGLRVLADIDLLVPLAEAKAAYAHLLHAGLQPAGLGTREVYGERFHHLPALRHVASGITVEVHRRVLTEAYDGLVPAAVALQCSTPLRIDDCAARLLSPTDRFAHALAHTQLQDGNFARGTPELRQLLELALLASRFGAAIDWPAVSQRFTVNGQRTALQETCAITTRLFAVPFPAAIASVSGDPLARVQRRLQRRVGMPLPLLWSLADTIRHRPAKLLGLLDPRTLAAYAARVPGYVRQYRWK
ncbi:MAG: nucleotidyltransferase family protein [Deltaproteobacteria bacterium]|nr:nucleotidyltransferase family protein [Deltaproteobacteria bacterium]